MSTWNMPPGVSTADIPGNGPESPITTNRIDPPVPSRQYDWEAIRRDYVEGDPIGRGPTEQAAMADLLEQEDGGYEPDYTDRAAADWWAGRTA